MTAAALPPWLRKFRHSTTDWARFPTWPKRVPVAYRITALAPCYFNRDGTFRFDPPVDRRNDYGVSYWGLQPEACYVEKWGDFSMGIPESAIAAASLSEWTPPLHARYANLVDDDSVLGGYGVDLAISHSNRDDYDRSQECGSCLQTAGFDGIVWTVRHAPAGSLLGLALFGPAHDPSTDMPALFSGGVKTDVVPQDLIDICEHRFHLRVLPSVPLP
jgi:hypothetical protein